MGYCPRAAKVDKFTAKVVANLDIADKNAQFMEILKIPPYITDLVWRKGEVVVGKIFDDGVDRKLVMLVHPTPKVVAISRVVVRASFGNRRLLLGVEQEIAMRLNGKVLPALVHQPTVCTTLAVERGKIIQIKLRRRQRTI
jgi:hypothetical protein